MDNRKELMSDLYPATSRPVARLTKTPQPLPPEPPSRRKKILILTIGTPLLAIILFYGVRSLTVKQIAVHDAQLIAERIEHVKQALIVFDLLTAQREFIDIQRLVTDVQNEASRYGLLRLAKIFSVVSPKLAAVTEMLTIGDQLTDKILSILQVSELLKTQAFELMENGKGETLIRHLSKLNGEVGALGGLIEEMKRNAAVLDYPVGDDILAFRAELYKSQQLLTAAIAWLSDINHVAIMFINPSEIRPGGGFPGSYAGVTIARGSLGAIEVKDIYDPDGQLDLKVVPPQPLQLITSSWGARDANWFFDFPTSARKTLFFLNNSKIYQEQSLEFSALLAVNVNVVSDILSVIGPIELSDYKLTLDSENFLDEVQREVRSGLDRITGEPKRILKVLTPILFERLGALTPPQKHELISLIQKRFAAKDMIAYIDDPLMQMYLQQLAIAGEVDQSTFGDLNEYLAVVNANIGGGKSDAVMRQSINLKSRIDLEGKINNTLVVKRTHSGRSNSASWYNTTNKDFLQIFTPRGSRALTAKGHNQFPAIAKFDSAGYETDRDLATIEESTENLSSLGINQTIAFNKTVFSGWLNTAPGTTKTFELQYVNPRDLTPQAFTRYILIFEKQSGVETELSFTIDAPPEYKWEENNSPTYTYQSKSVPGKLEIKLTLIPIRS
ncbi:MAG: DUF4012 domain-containing protein [bacterium]|nr:DUF4012 domain-containing protein [bacterium]